MKKISIFFLCFLATLVIILVVSFFFRRAEAPSPKFKGPTGIPFVKGPTEQPPKSL
jgi:hypothetical protein